MTTRHDPDGVFERTCPHCRITIRTNNPHLRYCSPACKKRAQWKRWWARDENKTGVRKRMRVYARRKRAQQKNEQN